MLSNVVLKEGALKGGNIVSNGSEVVSGSEIILSDHASFQSLIKPLGKVRGHHPWGFNIAAKSTSGDQRYLYTLQLHQLYHA